MLIAVLACALAALPTPYVVAETDVDVDADGKPDHVAIVSDDVVAIVDEEPCAGCGDRVVGRFYAAVTPSRRGRTVRSAIFHSRRGEAWWFWRTDFPAALVSAHYSGDGLVEFNLGQFVNGSKWEYQLFSVRRDGKVARLALDSPEIYTDARGAPSTDAIETTRAGLRFRDFGNAGERTGAWVFDCAWDARARRFDCTAKPD